MRPLLSLAMSSPRSFFIEAIVMLRTGVRFVSRLQTQPHKQASASRANPTP